MKTHQIISMTVTSSGQEIKLETTTEAKFSKLFGIAVEISDETAIPASLIGININEKEIFPSNFEVARLVCGNAVEPNRRFWFLDEKPMEINQTSVKIFYTDGGNYSSDYTVNVYLLVDKA